MQKQALIFSLLGILIGSGSVLLYQRYHSEMFPSNAYNQYFYDDMHMSNMGDGHMDSMQQMFVTSEREFIEHMIPHHLEAIDTAQEVLERGGTTQEIRELMNSIITAQTKEVESMRDWYFVWFAEEYKDSGEYEPMMRELEGLSGEKIDRAFLEDMIIHHMGAIMMARSVQPYVEHNEMSELTKNIVSTQSAEIVRMREMLQEL